MNIGELINQVFILISPLHKSKKREGNKLHNIFAKGTTPNSLLSGFWVQFLII